MMMVCLRTSLTALYDADLFQNVLDSSSMMMVCPRTSQTAPVSLLVCLSEILKELLYHDSLS